MQELHDALLARYGMEHETWAIERIARVMAKLNRVRRGKPKLRGHILGIRDYNAFTFPGENVYISRRLLERCANDAEAAMILAHEVAHHDLGHLESFKGWAEKLPRSVLGEVISTAYTLVENRIHSQANELAADAHAFVLCRKAKYDPVECAQMFDILRMHAIDVGALDAAYGEDEEEVGPIGRLFQKLKTTHPSIRDRKDRLLASLKEEPPRAEKPRKGRAPAAAVSHRVPRRAKRS